MDKPDALRLADELDQYLYSVPAHPLCTDAAAELRRLQIQNAELTENLERKSVAIQRIWKERDELRRQRGALLEALREAQACFITQDITRQEYERLYPDAVEETK